MDARTFREVSIETWRTDRDDPPVDPAEPIPDQVMHGAAGVAGEMGEHYRTMYAQDGRRDEFGDLLYYLSMLRRAAALEVAVYDPFDSDFPLDTEGRDLLNQRDTESTYLYIYAYVISPITECAKKVKYANERYDDPEVTDEMIAEQVERLDAFTQALAGWAGEHAARVFGEGELPEIRRENVEKLQGG